MLYHICSYSPFSKGEWIGKPYICKYFYQFDHRSNNPKSRKCITDSYRPSYHSLGYFALSPQLQYMLLLGEGATLNGKGVKYWFSTKLSRPKQLISKGLVNYCGCVFYLPFHIFHLFSSFYGSFHYILPVYCQSFTFFQSLVTNGIFSFLIHFHDEHQNEISFKLNTLVYK